MQAFIPAAGLGTRLLTLTEHRPKALVEVGGVPLLEIAIDNLARQGVTRIVVNVHHFADMVIDYLQIHDWGTEVLVSNEKDKLLDTGGGLKKAAPLFHRDEPILIHNVDILSRINFHDLVELHQQDGNFVTLAVSVRDTSRFLLFADNGLLVGWKLSIEHLHSVELQYSTRVFWRYFLRVRFPIRLFPLTLILPKNIESVISSIVLRIGWTLGPLSH